MTKIDSGPRFTQKRKSISFSKKMWLYRRTECKRLLSTGCKIPLSDVLGCILSDVPRVMGVSGLSTSDPLHPGDPAGVDQVPAYIPAVTSHGSALFI